MNARVATIDLFSISLKVSSYVLQNLAAGKTASIVDRVAIVRRKGYRVRVDFLTIHSGLSSSWWPSTPRRILSLLRLSVCVGLKGTVCLEKMATALALIVNEEPRSTTELAFANCGKQ